MARRKRGRTARGPRRCRLLELPNELLHEILKLALDDHSRLRNVLLSCRTLWAIAAPLHYDTVTLSGHSVGGFARLLREAGRVPGGIGPAIRELTATDSSAIRLLGDDLSRLTSLR